MPENVGFNKAAKRTRSLLQLIQQVWFRLLSNDQKDHNLSRPFCDNHCSISQHPGTSQDAYRSRN
jgi:hypothetical protein